MELCYTIRMFFQGNNVFPIGGDKTNNTVSCKEKKIPTTQDQFTKESCLYRKQIKVPRKEMQSVITSAPLPEIKKMAHRLHY